MSAYSVARLAPAHITRTNSFALEERLGIILDTPHFTYRRSIVTATYTAAASYHPF